MFYCTIMKCQRLKITFTLTQFMQQQQHVLFVHLVTFVLHHFITLCLVRRSSSERLAVMLGWRLSLLVWCWRSELLSQLGPAGGDREPDCCRNLKTEQGLSNARVNLLAIQPTPLISGYLPVALKLTYHYLLRQKEEQEE